MCSVVLRVTRMEGQETKMFLGARKPTSLLVGWEDNFVVPLWASGKTFGKRMLGSVSLLHVGLHCK
jgi:hypothetical protein